MATEALGRERGITEFCEPMREITMGFPAVTSRSSRAAAGRRSENEPLFRRREHVRAAGPQPSCNSVWVVVLIVLVVRALLGRMMMADGATGRRAEEGMVAGYVPDDRSGCRACQTSRLRARRRAEGEAKRGNNPEIFHGSFCPRMNTRKLNLAPDRLFHCG